MTEPAPEAGASTNFATWAHEESLCHLALKVKKKYSLNIYSLQSACFACKGPLPEVPLLEIDDPLFIKARVEVDTSPWLFILQNGEIDYSGGTNRAAGAKPICQEK